MSAFDVGVRSVTNVAPKWSAARQTIRNNRTISYLHLPYCDLVPRLGFTKEHNCICMEMKLCQQLQNQRGIRDHTVLGKSQ